MAHFAKINDDNIVVDVVVTDNNYPNEGYDWLVENFDGRWIKTSFNATIRGKFAAIGDLYDETLDEFTCEVIEDTLIKEEITND